MARKQELRPIAPLRPIAVGAGITEFWYLKHIKPALGLKVDIFPRLFGRESMPDINKHIETGLANGRKVICLFDEDVSQWNDIEKQRLRELHNRYDSNPQVVIASSMPSIEYWLLLHYKDTNKYYGTSAKVIKDLIRYIPGFDKREQFLSNPAWVTNLLKDNKLSIAEARAKKFGHTGASYTDAWKAIEETLPE